MGLLAAVALPAVHAAEPSDSGDDVDRLAAQIDFYIEARWGAEVVPASPTDDAEFLRRVYLDLAGRIPPVSEVREFLDDPAPDKRRRMVDQLLDGPQYVNHFSVVWRNWLLAEIETNPQVRFFATEFDAWMRKQLANNRGYDKLVHELLTVPVQGEIVRPRLQTQSRESRPSAFFLAKEMKAENLAASTARLFLGLRLDCAECHDHPFTHWKREDFWSYAAFFQMRGPGDENTLTGALNTLIAGNQKLGAVSIQIPETEQVVAGRFLGSADAVGEAERPPRELAADWIVARDNPYFAQATVNRMWGHFLGIGLVDPVDDFDAGNAPSHPELLDELARQFVEHEFDLKFLIRAITASRAYQLSSRMSHPSQRDARLFARATAKALSGDQLVTSLRPIVGVPVRFLPNAGVVLPAPDRDLQELFALGVETAAERQTSVLQALAMMNGERTVEATNPLKGALVAAVAEFPGTTVEEKIETLFLATLSRKPRPEELARLARYVVEGGPDEDERLALTDVVWALLNTSEFLTNH